MDERPPVIGMVGAECTGKTSLARSLSASLTGLYVDEQLRQWVTAHARTPDAQEQRDVLEDQRAALAHALMSAPAQPVIVDTAPLMTAVYSAAYFDDDSLWEPALEATVMCTHLIWCMPDFPWHADPGMRDGEEWRDRVHSLLRNRMPEFSARWPVIAVEGNPDLRLNRVLTALRGTS